MISRWTLPRPTNRRRGNPTVTSSSLQSTAKRHFKSPTRPVEWAAWTKESPERLFPGGRSSPWRISEEESIARHWKALSAGWDALLPGHFAHAWRWIPRRSFGSFPPTARNSRATWQTGPSSPAFGSRTTDTNIRNSPKGIFFSMCERINRFFSLLFMRSLESGRAKGGSKQTNIDTISERGCR